MKGLVFNIQKFSLHDGPGVRDLIFLKGCPLRCQWCSNPESQRNHQELSYNENRCIGWKECGLCAKECPLGAITRSDTDKIVIDRDLCDNCGKCAKECPAKALKLFGDYMSVADVLKISEEDDAFHSRSGGGVTISGGEPTVQADFVQELLIAYRDHGIHAAVETCGYAQWEDLEKICRQAKLILFDLKSLDSEKHIKYVGVSNERILGNLNKIGMYYPEIPIIVRTPIIPEVNDNERDIGAIVQFLLTINSVYKYELLEYHRFGEAKYAQLGRKYPFQGVTAVSQEKMKELVRIADQIENCHRC